MFVDHLVSIQLLISEFFEYLEDKLGFTLYFIALISFLGNAVPYLTTPYLFFVLLYISSARNSDLLTLSSTILTSSACAALGKVVVYYLGRGFRTFLIRSVDEDSIKLLNKLLDKGIFFTIFIFAASPLPDDVLYIPVGVLKYPVYKFYVACFLGKTVITSLVVLFGELVRQLTGIDIIATCVSIAVTVIVLYIMRRINWTSLVSSLVENGIVKTALDAIRDPRKFLK